MIDEEQFLRYVKLLKKERKRIDILYLFSKAKSRGWSGSEISETIKKLVKKGEMRIVGGEIFV